MVARTLPLGEVAGCEGVRAGPILELPPEPGTVGPSPETAETTDDDPR